MEYPDVLCFNTFVGAFQSTDMSGNWAICDYFMIADYLREKPSLTIRLYTPFGDDGKVGVFMSAVRPWIPYGLADWESFKHYVADL